MSGYQSDPDVPAYPPAAYSHSNAQGPGAGVGYHGGAFGANFGAAAVGGAGGGGVGAPLPAFVSFRLVAVSKTGGEWLAQPQLFVGVIDAPHVAVAHVLEADALRDALELLLSDMRPRLVAACNTAAATAIASARDVAAATRVRQTARYFAVPPGPVRVHLVRQTAHADYVVLSDASANVWMRSCPVRNAAGSFFHLVLGLVVHAAVEVAEPPARRGFFATPRADESLCAAYKRHLVEVNARIAEIDGANEVAAEGNGAVAADAAPENDGDRSLAQYSRESLVDWRNKVTANGEDAIAEPLAAVGDLTLEQTRRSYVRCEALMRDKARRTLDPPQVCGKLLDTHHLLQHMAATHIVRGQASRASSGGLRQSSMDNFVAQAARAISDRVIAVVQRPHDSSAVPPHAPPPPPTVAPPPTPPTIPASPAAAGAASSPVTAASSSTSSAATSSTPLSSADALSALRALVSQ